MNVFEKTEYIINDDNSVRYILGKYSKDPLVVFGINPSTADSEKNDTTISIVEHISTLRNKDGYIMLNLYPQRATHIKKEYPHFAAEEICKQNLQHINRVISDGAEIVAAWGTHIKDRKYFVEMLEHINNIVVSKNAKWVCLAKTKKGHPHHPTRLAYEKMTFDSFDMCKYIENLKK